MIELLVISDIMYIECVMVAHAETQVDQEMHNIKEKDHLVSRIEVEQTPQYKDRIQTNSKYIGGQLLETSRIGNKQLKNMIKKDIDLVLVAPQVASLQTCLDIYGGDEDVEVHVDPLLQPRINSAANIPTNIDEVVGEFKKQPNVFKVEDKNWFLSFGSSGGSSIGEIGNPQEHCLQMIKKNGTFETSEQFMQRVVDIKKELFDAISKSKKKVALITHPEVLEALTATSWHPDGKLVNPVMFEFGEIKSEHMMIEGVQGEAEESHVPFCG